MSNTNIPKEFDLKSTIRYRRQNMTKAMRGRIERGLVELITNSDDSYRDLEEISVPVVGKIRIEIERRRRGRYSIIKLRDRACGMTGSEMYSKLGTVGDRTSGFEKGKSRRGLYGRGAKDVAVFGCTHFESIKDGKYSYLTINPLLGCNFKAIDQKATEKVRDKLGIQKRGNGTVVTIEVGNLVPIPLHDKLIDILSRYYSLRDIMANPKREITLLDIKTGKESRLLYNEVGWI